eukprot:GHVN01089711.1.p1 GENE.GHVN01089711.1~~GHVN01089711.1.p1  ORF type:complete len:1031 (+),score=131.14 GHVN01089711.1:166-3258(+)
MYAGQLETTVPRPSLDRSRGSNEFAQNISFDAVEPYTEAQQSQHSQSTCASEADNPADQPIEVPHRRVKKRRPANFSSPSSAIERLFQHHLAPSDRCASSITSGIVPAPSQTFDSDRTQFERVMQVPRADKEPFTPATTASPPSKPARPDVECVKSEELAKHFTHDDGFPTGQGMEMESTKYEESSTYQDLNIPLVVKEEHHSPNFTMEASNSQLEDLSQEEEQHTAESLGDCSITSAHVDGGSNGSLTLYIGPEYEKTNDQGDLLMPTMTLKQLVNHLCNSELQQLLKDVVLATTGSRSAAGAVGEVLSLCTGASEPKNRPYMSPAGSDSDGPGQLNQFDLIQIKFVCDQTETGFCRVMGLYAGMTLHNVHRALAFSFQHEEMPHDELFHAFVLPDGTVYGSPPPNQAFLRDFTVHSDRSVTLRDLMSPKNMGMRLVYVLGKMQLQGTIDDILVGHTSQQDLLWLPRVCEESFGIAPSRLDCYDDESVRTFKSTEQLDIDKINKVLSETRFGKNLNGRRGESKRVGLERYACTPQYILKSFRQSIREFFTGQGKPSASMGPSGVRTKRRFNQTGSDGEDQSPTGLSFSSVTSGHLQHQQQYPMRRDITEEVSPLSGSMAPGGGRAYNSSLAPRMFNPSFFGSTSHTDAFYSGVINQGISDPLAASGGQSTFMESSEIQFGGGSLDAASTGASSSPSSYLHPLEGGVSSSALGLGPFQSSLVNDKAVGDLTSVSHDWSTPTNLFLSQPLIARSSHVADAHLSNLVNSSTAIDTSSSSSSSSSVSSPLSNQASCSSSSTPMSFNTTPTGMVSDCAFDTSLSVPLNAQQLIIQPPSAHMFNPPHHNLHPSISHPYEPIIPQFSTPPLALEDAASFTIALLTGLNSALESCEKASTSSRLQTHHPDSHLSSTSDSPISQVEPNTSPNLKVNKCHGSMADNHFCLQAGSVGDVEKKDCNNEGSTLQHPLCEASLPQEMSFTDHPVVLPPAGQLEEDDEGMGSSKAQVQTAGRPPPKRRGRPPKAFSVVMSTPIA